MALRTGRRPVADVDLNINSMMDMMTIILVFLLKSYSASDISISPSEVLTLPSSEAIQIPQVAVNLVIAKDMLTVDGVPLIALTELVTEDGTILWVIPEEAIRGQLITALYDVLSEKAATAIAMGEQLEGGEFTGRLLLQLDRDLHYGVLREVMYTAGQARFGKFEFVVYSNAG